MNVMSYALYWSPYSRYEHPNAGAWTGFKFYPSFLPALVRAHHVAFPGYELRLHHDGCVADCYYGSALLELNNRGLVTLRYCGKAETLCGPMLWRLLPIWEPGVEYVFCRDVDALPMPRDRIAIESFMTRRMSVAHAIYDHPAHGTGLCGGMIGFDAARFRVATRLASLAELLALGPEIDLNVSGADQDLMNRHLLPVLEPHLTRMRDLPKGDGLDQLAPGIGRMYQRSAVIEFCKDKGRTAEIEAVEQLTETSPYIERQA